MRDKTDLPWRIFQNINGFIASADAKASGIIAAEGVVLGVALDNLEDIKTKLCGTWACFPAIAAGVLLLASLYFALRCILPRLKINYPVGPASVIYFKSIASMDYSRFSDGLNRAVEDEDHAVEHIAQQTWINSHIATEKFSNVQDAVRMLAVATLFAIIAVLAVSV